MRKAFNFFNSYYDVAKELNDKDRLDFLWAIIQRQFEGIEPNLKGQAKFAYISQKFNIDSQVAGYETKTGVKLTPLAGATQGGSAGATDTPSVQEEEKGKGKVEYTIDFVKLLSFLNSTLNRQYKTINDSVKAKYKARLKEGYTKHDIITAITNASKDQYHIETNYKYLTPEFFSRADKLDRFGTAKSDVKDWQKIREALPYDEIYKAKQLPDLLKHYCQQYGITENELLTLHDTK